MGLKASKGKKYPLDGIFARHFIATAKDVGFSIHQMNTIIDEFVAQLPGAIESVNRILPEDFPEHISQAIFENSLKMTHRLTLGR